MGERPLSVREAADMVGVSVDAIRRAYRSGHLPAYQPAGQVKVLIRREDLDEWLFGDQARVTPREHRSRARSVDETPARTSSGRASRSASGPGSVERLRAMEG